MAKKSVKKNNLILEQNKSLFIICSVIVIMIGIIGFSITVSDFDNSGNLNSKESENGIIDDSKYFQSR